MQDIMPMNSYFERLRKLLKKQGIPSQTEIAQALGTDQPFVSRALAGELVRITPRVVALRRYAFMRIRAYSSGSVATAPAGEAMEAIRRSAIAECQDYLEAGFDPRVLQDQVCLLRRAQTVRH